MSLLSEARAGDGIGPNSALSFEVELPGLDNAFLGVRQQARKLRLRAHSS